MNQFYYDAVTKMEEMGVDEEYIQGWQAGFLGNPCLLYTSDAADECPAV